MTEKDTRNYLLLAVFVLAFSLRLLYLFEMRGHPSFLVIGRGLDFYHFHDEARHIAKGDVLLSGRPFRQAPLYSYFLASAYALFGEKPQAARVAQAFLSSLSALIIFLLASEMGGLSSGLFASIIFSFYGPSLFYDGLLLKTSFTVFLCLSFAFLFMRFASTGKKALACGLLLGALFVTRPNFVILLPLTVAGYLLFSKERRAVPVVLLLAGMVAAPAPFALRNILTHQPWHRFSSVGGRAIAQGQIPDSTRSGWDESPKADAIIEESGGSMAGITRMVLSEISRSPLAWAALQTDKLRAFLSWYEYPNNANFYLAKESSRTLKAAFFSFTQALVFFTAFLFCRQPHRSKKLYLFLTFALCCCLFPFYPFSRFRMPLASLMIVPSGIFLSHAWKQLREKRYGPLAAAVLAAAVSFAYPEAVSRHFCLVREVDYFNYGNYFLECRRYEESSRYYLLALRRNPGYLPAVNHLGLLYYAQGYYQEAESLWKESLHRDPKQQYLHLWINRIRIKTEPKKS